MKKMYGFFRILLIISLSINFCYAQEKIITFTEDNWTFFGGEVVEHLGREALKGTAKLNNVEFENGIIEFDIAVNGERSYPGIFFRVQSRSDYEHFYIRPHRAHYYPDALQYSPSFGNVGAWQLYNGQGYTAVAEIPRNEWVQIRIEINGSQARIFINNSETPNLSVDYLKHGNSKGWLTLNSPNDGSAFFSNFRYTHDSTLQFDEPEDQTVSPGIFTEWEISQSYKIGRLDLEKSPEEQGITDIVWQKVKSEPTGLVNVSKYIPRTSREPDCIFARTFMNSEKGGMTELRFGYSDAVAVFVNGELFFTGTSAYRQRDPSFLGIIGLFDSVYPNLKKGDNEILLIVAESFGGWGFMMQDGKAEYIEKGISKLWESKKSFSISESILYDKKRDVLYVTNFDQYNQGNPQIKQSISKVSMDGSIINLNWVDGLKNPLGMKIHNDQLYVAERFQVARIDLDSGKVLERYPIKGSAFINDLTIDDKGVIYITDSRKNVIWKLENGISEEWLSGEEIGDPNVIFYHDNKLFFGNSADRGLKMVDPATKEIRLIAKLDEGFIDGFRIDNQGNYLVSIWQGVLYRITPEGIVTRIMDTTTPGTNIADFEYINEKNLLIIPTFYGNTIVCYELE
jgi:sugar lactone lactonase YvrE